jgi:subtilisin-like proprotein convertase family protein
MSIVTVTVSILKAATRLSTVLALAAISFAVPQAVRAAETFCNPANLTIPAAGSGTGTGAPASPYPSPIVVSGVATFTTQVTIDLKGVRHTYGQDIDVLLVGPSGQKALVMSDVGGTAQFTGVNVTLDDTAANPISISGLLTSGTFKPTNAGASDQFPAPAPAPGTSTVLSVFNGLDGNGTWNLYVVDDASGDIGAMVSGWCINLTGCTADGQCADGDSCTVDTCQTGACVHTPTDCDDFNACTLRYLRSGARDYASSHR